MNGVACRAPYLQVPYLLVLVLYLYASSALCNTPFLRTGSSSLHLSPDRAPEASRLPAPVTGGGGNVVVWKRCMQPRPEPPGRERMKCECVLRGRNAPSSTGCTAYGCRHLHRSVLSLGPSVKSSRVSVLNLWHPYPRRPASERERPSPHREREDKGDNNNNNDNPSTGLLLQPPETQRERPRERGHSSTSHFVSPRSCV